MKWINVKDKLPQDGQMCLVTAKIYFIPDHVDDVNNYIGVEIKRYSVKYGWGYDDSEVFAWMPLPEPYKDC